MKKQMERGDLSGDQPSALGIILIYGKRVTGPERRYLPLSFFQAISTL